MFFIEIAIAPNYMYECNCLSLADYKEINENWIIYLGVSIKKKFGWIVIILHIIRVSQKLKGFSPQIIGLID